MALKPVAKTLEFQGRTAENNVAKMQLLFVRSCFFGPHQLTEGGGGLVENRYAFASKQLVKRGRIAGNRVRHDHDRPAIKQGTPELPNRKIECKRVEQSPHILV